MSQVQKQITDEMIEAQVRYVTFRSEDRSFAICSMDRLDRKEAITAIGPLANFHTGDRLNLIGRFETHGKYGLQFRVQMVTPIPPKDQEAIREYLLNAKIKGIGPKRIERLIDRFGDKTLKVISNNPEKLSDIKGLSEKHIQLLRLTVKDQGIRQEVMLFLYDLKLSAILSAKIWSQYQERTRQIIEENPYRLITEIDFFTFEHADSIAQRLGWTGKELQRTQAALHVQLHYAYQDGHVCLPQDELLHKTARQLGNYDSVYDALQLQISVQQLVTYSHQGMSLIYQQEMANIEAEIAREIRHRVAQVCKPLSFDLQSLEKQSQLALADAQAQAITKASKENLLLLTGGPGTGKTTTVKTLLALFDGHDLDVALAAPTGRAAKRLSETTGQEAKTIHRLLDYQPLEEEFRRGADLPLESDVVLIDEMSMVDMHLFVALLRALPNKCRLILVGDANQLPSVGAGRIYHDLLSSECVPTITLDHIFRQAQESYIVLNAYHILQGQPLINPPLEPLPDFFNISARHAEHAAVLIEQLITKRIPARFDIVSKDIQVITPMYRGYCGADQLNLRLQSCLNPNGKLVKQSKVLRVGDRVMQLKNFYDKDVFNGDMGTIITRHDDGAVVDFGGRVINYTKENLHMLTLAYACSIHKSQGSEYQAVVIPVLDEHWSMLQRDLLYTAVTRGQKLVILITMPTAIQKAICNQASQHRYTMLKERLFKLMLSEKTIDSTDNNSVPTVNDSQVKLIDKNDSVESK